jgi:tetratricopeptide (TPR) repeat protein
MNFARSAFARRAAIAILSVFAAALPQVVIAQSDPIVGVWHLVPERSSATPGPLPYKSMTLNFSAAGKDLKHDVEGAYADGRPLMATTTIVSDGKYHPFAGFSEFDTSSFNRINPNTVVYIRARRGTTVITGSSAVSGDGKTLIFSEQTIDAKGQRTGTRRLFFIKDGVDLASLAPPPGAAVLATVVAPPPPPPIAQRNSTPDEDAGDAALEKGDNDAAIAAYTKAIDAKEHTARLYYDYVSRGLAYAKKGDNAQALKDMDEALKLKADDADARFRRAGIRLQEKQYPGAIEDFTAYLDADKDAMDPNRAMALRLRGFIFNTLQQDVKAQQDYDAACMINKQLDVCNN